MSATYLLHKKIIVTILIVILLQSFIPSYHSIPISTSTQQNEGTLSGYVTDPNTNPIPGAQVRVYFHGTYRENYTDDTGYYHVTDIPICYCLKNCTASHTWYYPEWVLMGIVENTTHDFILIPKNSTGIPPPYGPTEGYINIPYTFYFDIPEDPEHDTVYLQWHWDDGSNSEWYGPYQSGETASATHSWIKPDRYQIIVKIKDINGMTNHSDPHEIHISEGPQLLILPGLIKGGLRKVSAVIENIGDMDAQNIQWNITIMGGLLKQINTTTSGNINSLKANSEQTIVTNASVFGLGAIGITVTAEAEDLEPVSTQILALILFIYIYTPPIL